MKNFKISAILILKALFVSGLVDLIIYIIRYRILNADFLMQDLSSVSVVVSFLATLYTLVSAFVLIEVWNQFNGFSSLVDKETLLLKSIWKYTDYFNDDALDKKMKKAIFGYVEIVEGKELKELVQGVEVVTPSKETEIIGDVIDEIKFDDDRDQIAFSSIIKVYEDFISIRNEKNAAGLARLPFPMRFLFILFSILLVVTFALLGFNSSFMSLISVSAVIFGVIITYAIINDLDNPLGGLFSFESTAYKGVVEYVEKSEHSK